MRATLLPWVGDPAMENPFKTGPGFTYGAVVKKYWKANILFELGPGMKEGRMDGD